MQLPLSTLTLVVRQFAVQPADNLERQRHMSRGSIADRLALCLQQLEKMQREQEAKFSVLRLVRDVETQMGQKGSGLEKPS
jgi:hypothetical protein